MELAQRATILTPSLTLCIDSQSQGHEGRRHRRLRLRRRRAGLRHARAHQGRRQAAIEAGFTKYTPSSAASRNCARRSPTSSRPTTASPTSPARSSSATAPSIPATTPSSPPASRAMKSIIPAPYWLSYPEMVRLAGADPVFVQTKEENGWKMTAEEFQDAMTPRTKMVIINSPGNPTGAVYTQRRTRRRIVEVAADEEILILSDEIYEKLTYDGAKHVSVASLSPGSLRSHHHRQRLLQGLRDDRLAARLPRRARADRQGHRRHPEPQHFEPVLASRKRARSPRSRATSSRWATCATSSTCAASTWCSRLAVDRRASAWSNPQGAFYVLVNIGQLGLSSHELRRPPAQQTSRRRRPRHRLRRRPRRSASATRRAWTSSRRASIGSRSSARRCRRSSLDAEIDHHRPVIRGQLPA